MEYQTHSQPQPNCYRNYTNMGARVCNVACWALNQSKDKKRGINMDHIQSHRQHERPQRDIGEQLRASPPAEIALPCDLEETAILVSNLL